MGDINSMANSDEDLDSRAVSETFPRLIATGNSNSNRQGIAKLEPRTVQNKRESSLWDHSQHPQKKAASNTAVTSLKIQDAFGKPISLANIVHDDAADLPHKFEEAQNAVEDFFTVPPERWFVEYPTLLEDLDLIVKHGESRKLWEAIEGILERWSHVIAEGLLDVARETPQDFIRSICLHFHNWSARTQLLGGYLAIIEGRFLRPRHGKTIPHIAMSIFVKNVLIVPEVKETILEVINSEFNRWLTATEFVDLVAMGELVRVYTKAKDILKRESPNTISDKLDLNPYRWISSICINVLMDQLNPQRGPNPAAILNDWVDRYHKVIRLMNHAAEQMELKQLGQYAEFSRLLFAHTWFSRMKPLLAAAILEPNGSEQLCDVVSVLTEMEGTKALIEDFLLGLLGMVCDVVKDPALQLRPGQGTHLALNLYRTIGISLRGNNLLPWEHFSERCWKLITDKLPDAHSGLIDVLLNLVNASLADENIESHLETLKPLLRQLRESDEKIGWAFAGRMAIHLLPKRYGHFSERGELALINRMAADLGQNFLWRVRVMTEDLRLQQNAPNVLYVNPVAWPVSEMDKEKSNSFGDEMETRFNHLNQYAADPTKKATLHLNWTIVHATIGALNIVCTGTQFMVLKALCAGPHTLKSLEDATGIEGIVLAAAILDIFKNSNRLLGKSDNGSYFLHDGIVEPQAINTAQLRVSHCPD